MEMSKPLGKGQEVLLKCGLSPGDIVMLTAAVRDLHLSHPGTFITGVATSCSDLWRYNPYVCQVGTRARVVTCDYPLIHKANEVPLHFIHGYRLDMERKLGVRIAPTKFAGDVYLSKDERAGPPPRAGFAADGRQTWIVVAGGKLDYTAKWWPPSYYQAVVDALRNEVLFLQVGEAGHVHPRLSGVVDLRGRTSLRDLVRLVYHCDGIVCPVTAVMHLASAVPAKRSEYPLRPCVVIAGGREPAHWEAYPTHAFFSSVGFLPCCAKGGCWKSRTLRLGDGSTLDRREHLCERPDGAFPACMTRIKPDDIVRSIRAFLGRPAVDTLQQGAVE